MDRPRPPCTPTHLPRLGWVAVFQRLAASIPCGEVRCGASGFGCRVTGCYWMIGRAVVGFPGMKVFMFMFMVLSGRLVPGIEMFLLESWNILAERRVLIGPRETASDM